MNKKTIVILSSILLVTLCVPYSTVYASENYKVLLFDETITVLDVRTVQVSLNYRFMALLRPGYYYDAWYIPINTANAYGITVEDEYGALPFNVSVSGNWTLLAISLRRRVFANESYLLRISYLAADRIVSTGPERNLRMWTVTDRVYKENVNLTVRLPKGFGVVKYEPPFLSYVEGAGGAVLHGQMSGVSADTQYWLDVEFADTVSWYNVTCHYTFVNKGSSTEYSPEFEVPGPLSIEGQEIMQVSYKPTPVSTFYDESGNLRVKFRISSVGPGQSATVAVSYLVRLSLRPTVNDSFNGGLGDIPPEYLRYTSADKYWEVDDANIRSLSRSLTEGENSVLNKVRAIYDYVVNNIEYDDAKFQLILSGQNPGRYGALRTLNLGRGVCEDISDLFIALCRASGIPAIGVNGLVYIGDGVALRGEVAHTWVRVYIPGYGWLDVDPTWKLFGRLEGRHIAEALMKESSEPKYVGWMAYQPFQCEVKYALDFLAVEVFRPDLSVSAIYDDEVPVGSSFGFRLKLINYGNGTAYTTSVTISVPGCLRLLNMSSYFFDRIYEYESRYLNLVFNAVSSGNASIEVMVRYQVDGGEVTRSFSYRVVVKKVLTSLTCSVSPREIIEGGTVKVSGSISPALSGKGVTLTYIRPDGSKLTRTIMTGMDGSFSDSLQPDVRGLWSVYASWEGDADHEGASSPSVQFNVKAKVFTVISCSVSSREIFEGETVRVTGVISPAVSGVVVTLTYTRPDRRSFTRTVKTGSDGSFSDSYQPDISGLWSVYASWEGDAEYEGTESQPVQFNVSVKPSGEEETAEEEETVPTTGGSRCLIATATYGSELQPQVQFLRNFRDNVVLRTFAGSAFMELFNSWYYSWSPPVAASIAPNPAFKAVMQVVLRPLLEILSLSAATFSFLSFNCEFAIIVAGLDASALIGLVYFTPPAALILIAVARMRKRWILPKSVRLKILMISWAVSVALMVLGEVTAVYPLMMFATGAFVLLTIAVVVGAVSLRIAAFFLRKRVP